MKIFLVALFLMSCVSPPKKEGVKEISSWGIQLQNYVAPYDLNRIAESSAELWVIDVAEGVGKDFSAWQIEALKKKGKIVLAYMSIGEAESYRSYFATLSKSLLGAQNPKWKGNYNVHYWEKEWQDVIIGKYLKGIKAQGFDGVLLDVIDAYERYTPVDERAADMAIFIERISLEGRKDDPGFLVYLQNGLQIRRHLKDERIFLDAISGVNAESVSTIPSSIEDMLYYKAHGKTVLALEYPKTVDERKLFFERAKKLGAVPVAGEAGLKGELVFP